jgi:gamma-tubulin complex component 5
MLSPGSLHGVLVSFAHRATQVASIRQSIAAALRPIPSGSRQHSPQQATTKTQQAFAEACRVELGKFDRWVADLETTLVSGRSQTSPSANVSAASTPLHLRLELEVLHGELLDHIHALLPLADSPVLPLDTLYITLTSLLPTTDISVFTRLFDIFVASAEPVWAMLGDWLRRGMPVPSAILEPDGEAALKGEDDERSLDPEFFIQRDRDAAWADEDFWEAAYVEGEDGWPVWLGGQEVKDMVFEAGKARGLLGGLVGAGPLLEEWKEIGDVLSPVRASLSTDTPSRTAVLDITSLIGSYISPMCTIATFQLRRVIEEDCGLLEHLDAMEGLLFMKEFGIVDDWTAWLFQQVGLHLRGVWLPLTYRR